MVYLSKITTKSGDSGFTHLPGYPGPICKNSNIFTALGDIDELNSLLGIVIYHLGPSHSALHGLLENIQNDLFDVGSHLCTMYDDSSTCRITEKYIERLEQQIEELNEQLEPLKSFVLPGGSLAASFCHLARSVCRRAERAVWPVLVAGVQQDHRITGKYLNRLSDLLFIVARVINKQSMTEKLWKPGESWQQ